jgi:hypothetical protein
MENMSFLKMGEGYVMLNFAKAAPPPLVESGQPSALLLSDLLRVAPLWGAF